MELTLEILVRHGPLAATSEPCACQVVPALRESLQGLTLPIHRGKEMSPPPCDHAKASTIRVQEVLLGFEGFVV